MFRPRLCLALGACLVFLPAPTTRGEGPSPSGDPCAEGKPAARTDLYGDPLPAGASARLGTLRLRHPCRIRSLAFSPDGKTLASSAEAICLWDAATGRALLRIGDGYGPIAFSPDGKTLASAGPVNTACLWDVGTGREVGRLDWPDSSSSYSKALAFSPDGKTLAGKCFHTVRLWSVPAAGQPRLLDVPGNAAEAEGASTLAFSPDGKTLASAQPGDGTVRLWDADTGEERRTVKGVGSAAVAWSPDGTLVASAGSPVCLWCPATGEVLRHLGPPAESFSGVAFSPDGRLVAGGTTAGAVGIWEEATGRRLFHVPAHQARVWALAFSPDGKTLASAAGRFAAGAPSADADHVVRLWDVATGAERLPAEGHRDAVTSLCFAPDGKTVVSASEDRAVRLWDAFTGKPLRQLGQGPVKVGPLAFSPDGALVAGGDPEGGDVRVWDAAGGGELCRLRGRDWPAWAVTFGRDGKTLAAAWLAPDGDAVTAGVWRLDRNHPGTPFRAREEGRFERRAPAGFLALALSPGGEDLAGIGVADEGPLVRCWKLPAGEERLRLEPGDARLVSSLSFSADGSTLALVRGDKAQVWDAASGKKLHEFEVPGCTASPVALSPDGRTLVLTPLRSERRVEDNQAILWEVASGRERARLRGHRDRVTSLAFAPDGRTLVTGSADTTGLLWELPGARRSAGTAPEEVAALWDRLGGEDAAAAYAALGALAAAPDRAVAMAREQLAPAALAPRQVAGLLTRLDSDDFVEREAASRELESQGEAVEAALRGALAAPPSPEVRRRAALLLDRLGDTARLRRARALELLEGVGTDGARDALEEVSRHHRGSALADDAAAALRRLARRESQPSR